MRACNSASLEVLPAGPVYTLLGQLVPLLAPSRLVGSRVATANAVHASFCRQPHLPVSPASHIQQQAAMWPHATTPCCPPPTCCSSSGDSGRLAHMLKCSMPASKL